ncbi:hypothetical protein SLA2020_042440 [Shorea laevis]
MGISLVCTGFFLLQIILSPFSVSAEIQTPRKGLDSSPLFPPNFLFGTATSSYQCEGAYLSDGKGLNNWDVFTHKQGNILDGSTGDVAADHYHRYLEDIDLMEAIGVNSYRFSISWARILPKGRFGDINWAGINHYNKLIDALLLKGIKPFVTLTHLDFPQELEERYGSWLNPQSQVDFAYYADICFKFFGDRVKHWVTFNEPNFQVVLGYRSGTYPPSRCSSPFGNCTYGDSEREPFIAAHNMILSHAAAVNIYRTKYQKKQEGSIGIVMHAFWFEPLTNSSADVLAAERAQSFTLNWFLDPVIFGRYPPEMQNILGSILPEFSVIEQEKLKNGLDFIGINHYTSYYVQDCIYSLCEPGTGTSMTEGFWRQSSEKNGVHIGEPTGLDWLNVYPQGMEKIVTYVKERYNNMPMFITENGYGIVDKPNVPIQEVINDNKRVKYLAGYLDALIVAMRKGADVRGYFVWSLIDNFEWAVGYTSRFGLHHVDYETLKRTLRLSAIWYKNFIAEHYRTKYENADNVSAHPVEYS